MCAFYANLKINNLGPTSKFCCHQLWPKMVLVLGQLLLFFSSGTFVVLQDDHNAFSSTQLRRRKDQLSTLRHSQISKPEAPRLQKSQRKGLARLARNQIHQNWGFI